ncbi:amidase family protein [Kitasatospora sp. NPDC086009]|uniref:amidase family protein n=1 Tax=Kitasatospora sp. NPDC086009 TaxID=3364065 RepID=UPI0037C679DE
MSRSGIVPITSRQDTAGPIARNVTDAALTLWAIQGADPADPDTAPAEGTLPADYRTVLDREALRGKRIGVWRAGHAGDRQAHHAPGHAGRLPARRPEPVFEQGARVRTAPGTCPRCRGSSRPPVRAQGPRHEPGFPPDRDGSDDPFAVIGGPFLTVAYKRRGLLAAAGAHEYDEVTTVGGFHGTDRSPAATWPNPACRRPAWTSARPPDRRSPAWGRRRTASYRPSRPHR